MNATPAPSTNASAKHGTVLHANRARLPVLGDSRQRQRDGQHDRGRHSSKDERRHAVEPLPRQREPEPERNERREDRPRAST